MWARNPTTHISIAYAINVIHEEGIYASVIALNIPIMITTDKMCLPITGYNDKGWSLRHLAQ